MLCSRSVLSVTYWPDLGAAVAVSASAARGAVGHGLFLGSPSVGSPADATIPCFGLFCPPLPSSQLRCATGAPPLANQRCASCRVRSASRASSPRLLSPDNDVEAEPWCPWSVVGRVASDESTSPEPRSRAWTAAHGFRLPRLAGLVARAVAYLIVADGSLAGERPHHTPHYAGWTGMDAYYSAKGALALRSAGNAISSAASSASTYATSACATPLRRRC